MTKTEQWLIDKGLPDWPSPFVYPALAATGMLLVAVYAWAAIAAVL